MLASRRDVHDTDSQEVKPWGRARGFGVGRGDGVPRPESSQFWEQSVASPAVPETVVAGGGALVRRFALCSSAPSLVVCPCLAMRKERLSARELFR